MQPTRREWFALSAGLIAGGTAFGRQSELPKIRDTHVHFYDTARPQGVPWPGKDDKVLYRPVLPPEWRKLAEPLGVTECVVVEASAWPEDNQWLIDLAAKEAGLAAITGRLIPGETGFRKNYERFAKAKCFTGIRINANEAKEVFDCKQCFDDLVFLQGKEAVLEVNGGPKVLPDIAKLAKEFPKLTIVLNHAANPRIDGKQPAAEWRDGMAGLAGFSTVTCKLSGYMENTGAADNKAPADVSHYQAYFDVLWKHFGANRLMWGSNWPVSARFADYPTVVRIARELLKPKGEADSQKVLFGNSTKVYRLPRG